MAASKESVQNARKLVSFWSWLFDSSPSGGVKRWFTWHLLVHLAVGAALALTFSQDISDRARSVVLPLAGILVGLTFAWAATATAIVSSQEFRRIMAGSKQGVRGTSNYFQLAILIVLAATLGWAVVGLGPYAPPSFVDVDSANKWTAFVMFSITSFAIRECWGAINLTRLSLLGYNLVRESVEAKEAKELEEASLRDVVDIPAKQSTHPQARRKK